jgi:hypothetical protein
MSDDKIGAARDAMQAYLNTVSELPTSTHGLTNDERKEWAATYAIADRDFKEFLEAAAAEFAGNVPESVQGAAGSYVDLAGARLAVFNMNFDQTRERTAGSMVAVHSDVMARPEVPYMQVNEAALNLAGLTTLPLPEIQSRTITLEDKDMDLGVLFAQRLFMETVIEELDGRPRKPGLTMDVPSTEVWVDDNGLDEAGGTILADHRNKTVDSGRFLIQAYVTGAGVYDKASAEWLFFEYGEGEYGSEESGLRLLDSRGHEVPLPPEAEGAARLSLRLDENTQLVVGKRPPHLTTADRFDVLVRQGDDAFLVSSSPGSTPRPSRLVDDDREEAVKLWDRNTQMTVHIDLADVGRSPDSPAPARIAASD